MTKRPNMLIVLGGALFLIGGAIVFMVLRNGDSDSDSAKRALVPVLIATSDLSVGESGDAILASGRVVVKQVPASSRAADAITSSTELAGQSIGTAITSGGQVLAGSLRPPNLRTSTIKIPTGKQAVAVTVNFTNGGAGYAAAGDRVNIYAVVPPNAPNAAVEDPAGGKPTGTPYTKLLLSNVQVLDVSDEVAPRVAAAAAESEDTSGSGVERVGSTTLTLLLALDAQQAEQAIFATSVNQLYFTVLPKGQGASSTKGVGYGDNYPIPAAPAPTPDEAGK